MTQSLQAAKYALLAVSAIFVWQSLNVRFNYGGEWNALFLSGERFPVPAALAAERIPQLPGSDGYDGQFYHYVAHDPLMTHWFRGLPRCYPSGNPNGWTPPICWSSIFASRAGSFG
jgi:hypothetical protein